VNEEEKMLLFLLPALLILLPALLLVALVMTLMDILHPGGW
jgi:hypothetical protein